MAEPRTGRTSPRATGRDGLRAIAARPGLVALVTGLTVVSGLALSFLQTTRYRAEAEVLVNPFVNTGSPTGTVIPPYLQGERVLITSDIVLRDASAALGDVSVEELRRNLQVRLVYDANEILVQFTGPDPDTAARAANAVAEEYRSTRTQESLALFAATRDGLRQRIAGLEPAVRQIDERIGRTTNPEVTEILLAQRRSLLAFVAALRTRLATLESTATEPLAEIVRGADPAATAVTPSRGLVAVLALLAGLVLGSYAAVLRDRLAVRRRTDEGGPPAMTSFAEDGPAPPGPPTTTDSR